MILGGLLAAALVALSSHQGARWSSDLALWTSAQAVAPQLPDPWVHGAMALIAIGDPRDPHRLQEADAWLTHAAQLSARQPPPEQAWAADAIAATRAVIRMRQGRLREAAIVMANAPEYSARGRLCRHFRSVCALGPSSGS